jgi:hypothetical protein
MSFVTSVRPSSCINWSATGKISVKFLLANSTKIGQEETNVVNFI